jgi:general secretion pathway protein K
MRPRAERGVALAAVVMATAVLTAIAVGVASTAAVASRAVATTRDVAEAEALARSGIAASRAALVDAARASGPDTLAAPWLRPLDPQPLGRGVVQIVVEDEARRLDVNARGDALPRLLARIRLDPGLADAVGDWIDADDVARPAGAEDAWYRAERPPRLAANRPLRTVGELLLVRGVDATVLDRLRPLVTTASEDGVNPNTAPPDVMLAVWPNPSRVAELVAGRARGPVACDDLPGCTTRSRSYTVRATGTVGRATRTAEALIRVLGTIDAEVAAWRWTTDPAGATRPRTPESRTARAAR